MTRSRRAFVRAAAAGSVVAWEGRFATSAWARRNLVPRTAPKYMVRITLDGGFDSILTVDPKEPATAGSVDVGYRADERIAGKHRLFGPLIGDLVRHDNQMVLVHGVRCNTVAHDTGEAILRAGHQRYTASAPPFGDLVGELLPGGAPIPHLHIQTGQPEPFAHPLDAVALPGNPAGRELPATGGLSVDPLTVQRLVSSPGAVLQKRPWFPSLRTIQMEEARAILGAKSKAFVAHQQKVDQTSHLVELLATADRATPLRRSPLGPGLQLAFHALRGNHARCVTLRGPKTWLDTHQDNLRLQRDRLSPIFDDIAAFVDMLKSERNAFGRLFDQTTIAIASELGRFPKLNAVGGKDHWPENSWILLGRGIRGGVTIGATDGEFRGVAVNYRHGVTRGDELRFIEVDALFATLLHLAGGDLAANGYDKDSVLWSSLV